MEHRAFKSFKPLTQLEGGARGKGREEGKAGRRLVSVGLSRQKQQPGQDKV